MIFIQFQMDILYISMDGNANAEWKTKNGMEGDKIELKPFDSVQNEFILISCVCLCDCSNKKGTQILWKCVYFLGSLFYVIIQSLTITINQVNTSVMPFFFLSLRFLRSFVRWENKNGLENSGK